MNYNLMTAEQSLNAGKEERREFPRYPVALPIELHPAGSDVPYRLQTTDISQGGCYVEMAIPLEAGAALEIILWINEHRLQITGRVVTRHPQFGNGIEFTRFHEDGERHLEAFLKDVGGDLRRTPLPI